jgi:hypothetical protein
MLGSIGVKRQMLIVEEEAIFQKTLRRFFRERRV